MKLSKAPVGFHDRRDAPAEAKQAKKEDAPRVAVEIITHPKLTPEQLIQMHTHVLKEAQYAAERWVEAETTEDGCWCVGLDHKRNCRHWVLPH